MPTSISWRTLRSAAGHRRFPFQVDRTRRDLPPDLTDRSVLSRELIRMVDAVATRLHKAGVGTNDSAQGSVWGFHDDHPLCHHRRADRQGPCDSQHHEALLAKIDIDPGVRLLGVSVSQLGELSAHQLSFDDAAGPGRNETDDIVEAIRDRFGGDAIGPATLARPGKPLDRMVPGQQQWGPDDLTR